MKKLSGFLLTLLLFGTATVSAFATTAKDVIIYVPPEWGQTGTLLSPAEVTNRFEALIYSRNQIKNNLPAYRQAGFTGTAYLYMILDEMAGPNGNYASTTGQRTRCTETTFQAYSNQILMDPGDFCEVHNAILDRTCLKEYPSICPTETWFLHKQDGSRYTSPTSKGYAYQPNPGDPNWRAYFVTRLKRELTGGKEVDHSGAIIKDHLPVGVQGIFLDNLEISWSKVIRKLGEPLEYSTNEAYIQAVDGLVAQIHTMLSQNGTLPLWANLISSPDTGTDWNRLTPILEGAFIEDFYLDWGRGPYPPTRIHNQLTQLKTWLDAGKDLVAVAQGNTYLGSSTFLNQAKLAYAAFLLVTPSDPAYFFYDNYYGDPNGSRSEKYGQIHDFPERSLILGTPVGSFNQSASNQYLYTREFTCGQVSLNTLSQEAAITEKPCQSPTPTPPPATPLPLAGDFDQDGDVDFPDLKLLRTAFDTKNCALNLTGSSTVCSISIFDFGFLLTMI